MLRVSFAPLENPPGHQGTNVLTLQLQQLQLPRDYLLHTTQA
jgi:hypothetical protein